MSLISSLRNPSGSLTTFSRILSIFRERKCQISFGPGKTVLPQDPQQTSLSRADADSSPAVTRPPLPLILSRKIERPNPYVAPKQAWLESIDTLEGEKLGIVDLHPDIFGASPRYDALYENIRWQLMYRKIDYRKCLTRAEVKGGGRKPWPQKKTGRHRAGSIRAPQWKGGGMSHGPRGPRSQFYMLANTKREMGLRMALTVKYTQNDLHIVDSLNIPTDDPEYLDDLIDTRYWGFSVLFVDDTDVMPRNISLATNNFGQFNLMPVYGLNVYSMLKHETLVLTLAAVEKIEEKLVEAMHNPAPNNKFHTAAYRSM